MVPGGCDIGSGAFQFCRSLSRVTFRAGCRKIECAAFSGCTALASVTLPSSLKLIGENAFGNCPSLATMTIPRGCQVSANAFKGSRTRVTEL
jgi:hypothetical protein